MSSLNAPQRSAVAYNDGPLLVLAGAGSGKTRVIIEKIAQLISSGRYKPEHIAAITFTNKAAREMRERVHKRIKSDSEGLTICTFHALGLRFLHLEHSRAGLRRGFSIFDTDDQAGLLKDLLPDGSKPDAIAQMQSQISKFKNAGLCEDQAGASAKTIHEREAASVYLKYQSRLRKFNAVDFDDLIRLPLKLLDESDELAATWRERLRYLLVDECQDTNDAQYRLLRHLAGPRGAMTCVGDDDQSIYGWRGARPENLAQMALDYPQLKIIKLEQNYRCSGRILRSANRLIAQNPHEHLKQLWSDQGDGEKIRVWACKDADHEAERVAAEISYLHQAKEIPYAEFAVLFRGNHQSRAIEKALQLLRIPYVLSGGTAFLDRSEVKDVLAWLRLISNPDDDAAFLRSVASPSRGVGATTLEQLAGMAEHAHLSLFAAASQISLLKQLSGRAANGLQDFVESIESLKTYAETQGTTELVARLLEKSGMASALRQTCKDQASYERKLENLKELGKWLDDGVQGGNLAAQLSLLNQADRDESGNAVRLMSLHASKGLEFRSVFVIGVEDGNLPHEMSVEEGSLDEERRLLYVGITRAKQHLVLSHCAQTKKWGETLNLLPSRFFKELPPDDLACDGADPEAELESKKVRGRAHLDAIAAFLNN